MAASAEAAAAKPSASLPAAPFAGLSAVRVGDDGLMLSPPQATGSLRRKLLPLPRLNRRGRSPPKESPLPAVLFPPALPPREADIKRATMASLLSRLGDDDRTASLLIPLVSLWVGTEIIAMSPGVNNGGGGVTLRGSPLSACAPLAPLLLLRPPPTEAAPEQPRGPWAHARAMGVLPVERRL